MNNEYKMIDINVTEQKYEFQTSIVTALAEAENELASIEETIASIDALRPACDKTDYILAASSGALCGIIDVFLVGKPGESPIGKLTDNWFANRVKDFAKLCGWDGNGDLASAIRFLEKKFKVPYDQTSPGDIAKEILGLNAKNHHFKSLAHNPTLLGLFFSILDQFQNTSHFVSDGRVITIDNANGDFELRGNNIPAKLICGFINWFGHLISDMSGSSGSKGRGMGIPSSFWCWVNDIAVLKAALKIPPSDFDAKVNDLAVKIFEKGFDTRFQTVQMIPVFVNEILVRFMYSVRRLIRYYKNTPRENRCFETLWNQCEPFSNPTVKRMLTVAHGTFCIIDIGDAAIRGFAAGGGTFNPCEFFLRLNIAGVGRFVISLYGEVKRGIEIKQKEQEIRFARKEQTIILNYINGLKALSYIYDDIELVNFIDDLERSDLYIQAFEKTVALSRKRGVPENIILKSKQDIDEYFKGGKK